MISQSSVFWFSSSSSLAAHSVLSPGCPSLRMGPAACLVPGMRARRYLWYFCSSRQMVVSTRHSALHGAPSLGRDPNQLGFGSWPSLAVKIVTKEEVRAGDVGQNSGLSRGLTTQFIRMSSVAGIRKPSYNQHKWERYPLTCRLKKSPEELLVSDI